MNKPPLSLLISYLSNKLINKISVLKPVGISYIMKKLLIDIYKRLNTKVTKRVINVLKRVQTFDVINNQKIVNLTGLRLSGSCGYI